MGKDAQLARRRVWSGERRKTSGGLSKGDLMKTKDGRIVSKKAHHAAKRLKNLGKHLENPPFPPFHSRLSKEVRKIRRRSKKHSK